MLTMLCAALAAGKDVSKTGEARGDGECAACA